jgi:hypothetical protein
MTDRFLDKNALRSKPVVVVTNWRYIDGSLVGDSKQGTVCADVLDVLKEADDVYIVEAASTLYLLDPPSSVERPFRFKENK